MNEFLCIAGTVVSILMLLGIWGMQDMPQRSRRPPEHPPGWKNRKKKTRK